MEVRCGKCNKLFRVSDDKISGSGIKFPCTRCGEYVKITREDFEQYTLSKSAASALDMFEPKPKAAPAAPAVPPPAPGPQPRVEPAASEPAPQAVRPAASAASHPEHVLRQTAHKEEPAPAREEKTAREAPVPAPSRSGKLFLIFTVTLIIAGLAGYGAFTYYKPFAKKDQGTTSPFTSIEGLTITNPAGSIGANGDLVITGVLENALDKERTAWYVVAEVLNAQGTVLARIRLLNGKQIYTRRDYEILAKRGANVQELKANSLQQQGVVIPPKGSVAFELRYLDPPVGIASFHETLEPFDPVQIYKEIAEEAH